MAPRYPGETWRTAASLDSASAATISSERYAPVKRPPPSGMRLVKPVASTPGTSSIAVPYADMVAAALVNNKRVAMRGLAMLTVGPQLLRYVNEEALERQAREVSFDKHARKAERTMSHPLLLRRIAVVLGIA